MHRLSHSVYKVISRRQWTLVSTQDLDFWINSFIILLIRLDELFLKLAMLCASSYKWVCFLTSWGCTVQLMRAVCVCAWDSVFQIANIREEVKYISQREQQSPTCPPPLIVFRASPHTFLLFLQQRKTNRRRYLPCLLSSWWDTTGRPWGTASTISLCTR